jgi:hypothetical protein
MIHSDWLFNRKNLTIRTRVDSWKYATTPVRPRICGITLQVKPHHPAYCHTSDPSGGKTFKAWGHLPSEQAPADVTYKEELWRHRTGDSSWGTLSHPNWSKPVHYGLKEPKVPLSSS